MPVKKILFRFLITVIIIFIPVFIFGTIYVVKVYVEYYANREQIFETIELFSDSLEKANDTGIRLGRDSEEKIKDSRAYFYDRNGEIIAQFSPQRYKLIKLNYIPFFVSRGFLLIEDNRFYYHKGFNVVRLAIGILKNVVTFGHAPGGSTISQQLSKILFTNQSRTIKRKIYEFFCTLDLEKRFTKNQVLQIYLNSIYLGHGVYGIASASNFYFGKDASELNIAEAALLIGMNRSPELYSPLKYKDRAARIQRVVLNQFVKAGYLSKAEEDFEAKRFWEKFDQIGVSGNQSLWKTEINRSGYVTEYIRQILEEKFDYDDVIDKGIIVETSIDIKKQMIAEKVIKDDLKYVKNKILKTTEKLKNYSEIEENIKKLEAALVSIDFENGDVLVLAGGSNYNFNNQLNRSVNMYRPIGSSVKPFIYSVALNDKELDGKEINPFTKFKDEIVTYNIDGKKYAPKNYHANHKYGNMVTLYDAVKYSLNTISVSIFDKISDKDKVVDLIRYASGMDRGSAKKRIPKVLSLALGTCELSPLELARAYSIFPRQGDDLLPVIVKKIYDRDGTVYYDRDTETGNKEFEKLNYDDKDMDIEKERVITPEVAYEIVEMMASVFESGGTGVWPASVTGFDIEAYGKSGTTQNFKDGWFAGFTNNETSVVWVGLDNNQPIYLSGSATAGVIWCDYNLKANSGLTIPIERPKNMKLETVCLETGLIAVSNCPVKKDFYFWNDASIPEKCYIHDTDILPDL